MRRLALSFTLLAFAAAPAGAAEIVVYDDTNATPAAETAERERELGFDAGRTYTRAIDGFAAELTPEQEQALERDPEVAAVIEDRPVRKQGEVPAVQPATIPPGIRRALRAPVSTVREQATSAVAVLDTGVDLEHPDLNVTAGTTCIGSGAPDDIDGHGTHVAGTIGAKNNGSGVIGIAPGTKILAVKVLDDDGNGSTSTVLCGIEWVLANRVAHDIEVANLSLGGSGSRTTCANDYEHNAYCRLADAGITTVVAAGNDGWDFGGSPPDIPASYPEVLTVAAIADSDGVPGGSGATACGNADDEFAWFSNFATLAADADHLVAAPGVCIRSTLPGGGTGSMSGTSMAAPHVAGLVALCHGEAGAEGPCSNLTARQVVAHMVDTAAAETGFGYTPDLAEPTHLFGPFAILPGQAPTNPVEDPPPAEDPEADPAPQPEPQPDPDLVLPPAPLAVPTPGPGNQSAVAPPAEPAEQPAPASRPRLTLTPARLRSFRTKGLRARVTCATACRATFRIATVRAYTARKRRRLPRTLARATGRAVTLRPARRVRTALGGAKRLVVTVHADVATPGGTVRVSRTIALS